MREHFKGILWPRSPIAAKVRTGKKNTTQLVHRYVVIGMLVTDKSILQFEGKNELVLDGPLSGLARVLTGIKTRKPKFRTGDATCVLLSLNDL